MDPINLPYWGRAFSIDLLGRKTDGESGRVRVFAGFQGEL